MAKDDNLDAGEPNKDEKEKENGDEKQDDGKEEIHEQIDEVSNIHPRSFSFQIIRICVYLSKGA